MKHPLVKKIAPHLAAILVFLIVAVVYSMPAIKGMALEQHDVQQWEGAFQDSKNYAEKNGGKFPLWNKNMFSGMPNFQIGATNDVVNPAGYISRFLSLGLPKPANLFFLACIGFYVLACCFKVRSWLGIVVSIAYAYATYNPIIIAAGHETKMLAIAFMPTILGAVYLIFQKKYWLGGGLLAIFSSLIIGANHLQMFYYLCFALGFMAIAYTIKYIKEKEFKHLGISMAIGVIALIIGLAVNAQLMMSTYEYQKFTQRGGPSELTDTTKKEISKNGLDKEYAMSYSMYKSEPLVMFVPKLFGGGSIKQNKSDGEYQMEVTQEESKAAAATQNVNEGLRNELQKNGILPSWYSTYWGGIGSTDGPPYAGAILFILALIAMFVLGNEHKWYLLAGFLIICAISAGSYFDAFNGFMYRNFPLFNKFRAPSSALTVAQLMLSVLALLGLEKIISTTDKQKLNKQMVWASMGVGTLIVICIAAIFGLDFQSASETKQLQFAKSTNNSEVVSSVKSVLSALIDDRKSIAWSSLGRSFLFAIIGLGGAWVMAKKWLNWKIVVSVVGFFMLIDVATFSNHYFSEKKYVDQESNESKFNLPNIDKGILNDKSDFRIADKRNSTFSDATASYNFRNIGGYHSAKLRIYQDLIERQMTPEVLNMLNVKYVLDVGVTPDGKQIPIVDTNKLANGSAWFVKNINFVKNADAEMAALATLNTKETALVQEKFKTSIPFAIAADSTSKIELVKNNNDYVEYKATNAQNAFAVFSEIYYPAGWKAYIDGKETPIVKTNYALRGLALTPGTHKIEFKFLPEGFVKGTKISTIFAIIIGLIMLSLVYYAYKQFTKKDIGANDTNPIKSEVK